MAKKKKKKSYSKKKKSYKNPKRVRAAKRAYKKSGLYKYNLKKKHGKKSKKHGKKSRKHYAKRKSGGLSQKAHQIYQQMIDRGRTPQQAHKVAKRIDRMRTGRAKRYFEKEAVQAQSAQQLSNLFAGIGSAGHLAHSAGQR
jgi:hypothetical protein